MLTLLHGTDARPERTPSPARGLPLAIYVHIPFCVRKCHYCDFASGPAPDDIRTDYVAALAEEIRRSPWRGEPARTVFFGGGTPSELRSDQLAAIVSAIRETFHWPVDSPTEASIECNPGTINDGSFAAMRTMGFTRVSLGVQSFHDRHLQALGRIHSAAEARQAVGLARGAGFQRLSLDLIFCLPGQTLQEWQRDVEDALSLAPDHVSLYNLTIEQETEFGRRHRAGKLTLPDEDLSADMYEWSLHRMVEEGFELYEVSNFALPGEECLHNQVYWRREPCLGFGLGAVSFVDGCRWSVTRSMARYLQTAARDEGPEVSWSERLDGRAACGEAIMLALRTREGAHLAELAEQHGIRFDLELEPIAVRVVADGLARWQGDRLVLTHRGLLLANRVCAEFLAE